MDKPIINLEKGTTCTAWNYSGQRLAAGFTDGNLSIFDSTDPASSVFSCSSKFKVHESSIVKIIWAPPEYGDAVACICADGSLLLWEEVVEDSELLQWKLCKCFDRISSQVLDVQFGVSKTSLKLVAAYSDGQVKVFELLDPFELKNWQLQVSCRSASIAWNPLKGEIQQSSFVLGFNSDMPQMNSSKISTGLGIRSGSSEMASSCGISFTCR